MQNNIIGLKISKYDSLAKCISIIRKFDSGSMSDIKKRILNHEYILQYSRIDGDGLKNIIKCYNALTSSGIFVELYERDDLPTTIELLKNLDKTYDDISDEIDFITELECSEDD